MCLPYKTSSGFSSPIQLLKWNYFLD